MSVARFAFQACSFNHSDISPSLESIGYKRSIPAATIGVSVASKSNRRNTGYRADPGSGTSLSRAWNPSFDTRTVAVPDDDHGRMNWPSPSVTATLPLGPTACTCAPEIGRFAVSLTSRRIVALGAAGSPRVEAGDVLGDVGASLHALHSTATMST